MPLIPDKVRRELNQARARAECGPAQRAGKELAQKAKADLAARTRHANNEVHQAAKEGATYLHNKSRGKVYFT